MPASPSQSVTTLSAPALDFLQAARAANTKRAYRAALRDFSDWQRHAGRPPLPAAPADLAAYLAALAQAGARVATIESRHAAIAAAHDATGLPNPTTTPLIRQVMAGIRRQLARPPDKKAPIGPDELRRLLAALPSDSPAHIRARALLLVGFAGAFRRSELVALNYSDLTFTQGELRARVRRSKTDQEGHGLTKQIPHIPGSDLDPVAALRRWLEMLESTLGSSAGPLWRRLDAQGLPGRGRLTAQSVSLIIKSACEAAGLDPAPFAAHSLRSGFITSAFSTGAAEWEVQQQTGHKSAQVLRGYIQDQGKGAHRAALAAFGREESK